MLKSLLRTAFVAALALHGLSCPERVQARGRGRGPTSVARSTPSSDPGAPAPAPDERKPAPTMSYLGADWLMRPERIAEEDPERMLDALGIRPGMVVADIGAGAGYHTIRISPRVGAEGRVYATDIQEEMLTILKKLVRERGITNVVPVLSGDATTGLPPRSVDLALMVDVYHELSEPRRFLDALKLALRPGGRVALVEFRAEDPRVPILEEHKMTAAQVIKELGAAGFKLAERHDFLPWQHLLIFAVAGAAK
jgi:protein-L-isoaspartate O-methyltransferase